MQKIVSDNGRVTYASTYNEPINPCGSENEIPHMGLSTREHFAALAMQGLLNSIPANSPAARLPAVVAALAVAYADALISALNQAPRV